MSPESKTYVFAPFRLEPDKRLLTRNGDPIALTPKEFDTLLVLVEAGGRVVGKDQLVALVWPDSFVGDGSIARNISVLRKTLGVDLIQTLPRRGYRFTADVVSESGMPEDVAASPPELTEGDDGANPSPLREHSVPGSGHRYLISAAVLSFLLLVALSSRHFPKTASAHSLAAPTAPLRSLVIEKAGATDPLDEGFRLYAPDGGYTHVLYNRESNGFDRWKLVTAFINYYYRPLSPAEAQFTLQHDWKLTCTCAVVEGLAYLNLDIGSKDGTPRFDINLLKEGDKYFVALTQQISPQIRWAQKIEFPGAGDVDHPHTYELQYDHRRGTASLLIDGNVMFAGYRGQHQFQENRGVMFGTGVYLNATSGIAVFRTVHFEVN